MIRKVVLAAKAGRKSVASSLPAQPEYLKDAPWLADVDEWSRESLPQKNSIPERYSPEPAVWDKQIAVMTLLVLVLMGIAALLFGMVLARSGF
jgi:hypothetical protein